MSEIAPTCVHAGGRGPARCGRGRERAQAQGYNIEEFPFYTRGMTPERFHQVLTARGIVGLIIAPLRNDRDSLPIAGIGRQFRHTGGVEQ